MKHSRQYRWQLKKIAQGRCARCGALRQHYTVLCDECQVNDRLRQQKRTGSRPWHAGKRGRPPKVAAPLRTLRRR